MIREPWHALTEKEVFSIIKTTDKGLREEDTISRIQKYGYNELKKEKGTSPLKMFFDQFRSFLIIILVIATIVSFSLGEFLDGGVILFIVLLNAFMGFIQEYRASKAIEALEKITAVRAVVLREGEHRDIPSRDVVPGDILILEEGRQIAADARIINSHDLYADESTLTGESLPVSKDKKTVSKEVSIADMRNMLFKSTYVTRGYGTAVVVGTGYNTEIGNIAESVQKTKKEFSPLQQKLDKLGKNLGIIVLLGTFLIFVLGFFAHSASILELFLISVALAVASIPEGLPIIVTLTLAIGMQAMAKNRALVKKLLAVETLGTTSVICSDKTGTLTKNEMTVTKIYTDGKFIEVSGGGYDPAGEFTLNNKKTTFRSVPNLKMCLDVGAYCNNASLQKEDNRWKIVGDPTEGALIVAAKKANISPNKKDFVTQIPFSSERKSMSVIYKKGNKALSYVKGAPEKIVDNCTHILINGRVKKLDTKRKHDLHEIAKKMAGEPLRLLGLAYKKMGLLKSKKYTEKHAETDLIFVGFVGMVDPPRLAVKKAIEKAHEAGIRTVMITGDHKVTAVAIAKKIGIIREEDISVTGIELDSMGDAELDQIVEHVSVYSRVSPEHKLRIIQAFKRKDHVVAMTGDGVNDAPALKAADIGVSMGIKGTDVAKEASDMILQDDNYATIIKAVEKGRGIYANIRKFVKLMLSMNFSELFLVGLAAIASLPTPLLPLQILWINLVTDTLPGLALAVDPNEPELMRRKPRKRNESIFSGGLLRFIIIAAIVAVVVEIFVYLWALPLGLDYARTLVFAFTVIFETVYVFNCRSETKSIFRLNPFTNLKLVGAVLFIIGLQVAVVYLPFFQTILHTVPLALSDWALIGTLSLLGLAISPIFFHKPLKDVIK